MLTSVKRLQKGCYILYFYTMNDKKHSRIIYWISAIVLCTIGLQLYWNISNYRISKQQLINDANQTLDQALENYYTNLAKNNYVGFLYDSDKNEKDNTLDSIIEAIEINDSTGSIQVDSMKLKRIPKLQTFLGKDAKSETSKPLKSADARFPSLKNNSKKPSKTQITFSSNNISFSKSTTTIDSASNQKETSIAFQFSDSISSGNGKFSKTLSAIKFGSDSLYNNQFPSHAKHLKEVTSQIVISLSTSNMNLKKVDSIFRNLLEQKKIALQYSLTFQSPKDTIQLYPEQKATSDLSIVSLSEFLKPKEKLTIYFGNNTMFLLRSNMLQIGLSLTLVLGIIWALFYMWKIIQHQKQLSLVKNDLISNITHEFKTPISTISVALEGIQHFHGMHDPEKTKNYLSISEQQLGKLSHMVEKLLETASLDSDKIQLRLEAVDLHKNISQMVEERNAQTTKTIAFSGKENTIRQLDRFHFHHAVHNLIDNAILYGGDSIWLSLEEKSDATYIHVNDSGTSLTKEQASKIFEQFYRVPQGNKHDTKGFGIGLYYTKKIVEKHGGTISLHLQKDHTQFEIRLPHDKED